VWVLFVRREACGYNKKVNDVVDGTMGFVADGQAGAVACLLA
jgi:hypothetical protein